VPQDLDSLIYELGLRGITPILAHPERAFFMLENPDRVKAFVDKGVPLQVNAGSLLGRYGPASAKFAQEMLDRRQAHFLATDSHKPPRAPVMARVVEQLEDRLDPEYLEMLTSGSALCMIEGRALPKLPKPPPKKEGPKWLARFRRK